MTLYCPNDATALERVVLDEHLPTEAVGHQCVTCGGALLDTGAQRAVLGNGLSGGGGAPSRSTCPRCNIKMQALEAGALRLDGCVPCGHIWFDTGELVAVRALIRKLTGETQDVLSEHVKLSCSDCGKPIDDATNAAQAPIGLVCAACHSRPGFAHEPPVPGARTLAYRDAQVSVTHAIGNIYHGRAVVRGPFEGPLRATFQTWSWWLRLKTKLKASVPLDDSVLTGVYHVESSTDAPLRRFLRAPGVVDMLLDIAASAASKVEFGAGFVAVAVKTSAPLVAPSVLENHTRRLFDAYQHFAHNGNL